MSDTGVTVREFAYAMDVRMMREQMDAKSHPTTKQDATAQRHAEWREAIQDGERTCRYKDDAFGRPAYADEYGKSADILARKVFLALDLRPGLMSDGSVVFDRHLRQFLVGCRVGGRAILSSTCASISIQGYRVFCGGAIHMGMPATYKLGPWWPDIFEMAAQITAEGEANEEARHRASVDAIRRERADALAGYAFVPRHERLS